MAILKEIDISGIFTHGDIYGRAKIQLPVDSQILKLTTTNSAIFMTVLCGSYDTSEEEVILVVASVIDQSALALYKGETLKPLGSFISVDCICFVFQYVGEYDD